MHIIAGIILFFILLLLGKLILHVLGVATETLIENITGPSKHAFIGIIILSGSFVYMYLYVTEANGWIRLTKTSTAHAALAPIYKDCRDNSKKSQSECLAKMRNYAWSNWFAQEYINVREDIANHDGIRLKDYM